MKQTRKAPSRNPACVAADHASVSAALHPLSPRENALAVPEPAPAASAPGPAPAPPPGLDAHGFDPADYKWVPVLRKPRKDGWTSQRQLHFIRALADLGCVEHAAEAAGMSVRSCYRLRNSADGKPFAAAWDAALAHAARRLVDLAFDRAIHGTDEPVFDKEGRQVGRRMRQNDRLLMFLLRAYMPGRFRHAHHDVRTPGEALPPAPHPLDEALLSLEPVRPDRPHQLMALDEPESQLEMADLADGKLPHWYRGRGDADPLPDQPLGPDFERDLAAAKRKATGLPLGPKPKQRADDDDRWFLA